MKKSKPTRRNLALQKLFASQIYQEWLEEVTKTYERFGVPLPKEPIPEPSCFCHMEGWYKDMWDKVSETENSEEYKNALKEINGGGNYFEGQDQIDAYNEARFKYVLHPIGEYIDFLVSEHMGVSRFKEPRDFDIYCKFITKKLLHGAAEYTSPVKLSLRPDGIGKNKEEALWLKIEPHTTIEDIKEDWDFVKEYQERLPDYQERYRSPKNLKRDVRICELDGMIRNGTIDKGLISKAGKISYLLEEEGHGDVSEYVIEKVLSENKKHKQ